VTRTRHSIAATIAAAALLCFASLAAAAETPLATPATKKPVPAPKGAYRTVTRPLTLDAQTIEGKAESPRVLFVHMGPNIALEDAPKRPSYLRDDFTAALSSPVRLVVRPYPPLVLTPASGGNR
jgi:hypothetical protein